MLLVLMNLNTSCIENVLILQWFEFLSLPNNDSKIDHDAHSDLVQMPFHVVCHYLKNIDYVYGIV